MTGVNIHYSMSRRQYSKKKYLLSFTVFFYCTLFLTKGVFPFDGNSKLSFSGQVKNLLIYQHIERFSESEPNHKEEKRFITILNRVRLSPQLNLSDVFYIWIDFDNEIITGNALKTKEFDLYWRPSEFNDFLDLSWENHYDKDVLYNTKLHRAFAKLIIDDLTVTVGRQQIRYGKGNIWNPLDLLNPISPTFIEGPENQKGVDAIKLDYHISYLTELSLVIDKKREDSNIMGKFKTTVKETDIAFLGGSINQRRNIGAISVSSIFRDGIIRGGIIYSNPDDDKSFIQGNIGYEYNLSGIYFLGEYFYNERGLNYNEELKNTYLNSLIYGINKDNYYKLSNQSLTFNQHYLGVELGYDITPLVRGELFSIFDFQGRNLFINPSVKYNLSQDIDIAIGIMKAWISNSSSSNSDFDHFKKDGFYYSSLIWYF